jgi:hypothetical protein
MTDLVEPPESDQARDPSRRRANSQPSKGQEARGLLEVFVSEDFGNNWTAWEGTVKKWLRENPDI